MTARFPCLKIADPTGEYQTFLAFLPARLLARIYGEHGQRILERNVRAFLHAQPADRICLPRAVLFRVPYTDGVSGS